MAYTGDEGIRRKFFRDLGLLFSQKPQLDYLLPTCHHLGLPNPYFHYDSPTCKYGPSCMFNRPNMSDDLGKCKLPGDEGIRRKFFRDLGLLFSQKPQLDHLLPTCHHLGLPNPYFHYDSPTCKYGPICMFNHPTFTNISDDLGKSKLPAPSEISCKFYPAGLCKYGESCRFSHSKSEAEISPQQLNILGFPKRLGKKNCPFYMRTGMCDYGASCKFHHPDPLMVSDLESVNDHREALETAQPVLSLPLLRTINFPSMHQICVLNGYQASDYKKKVEIAGDYASKIEPCVLNDDGLPIRPGKKVCLFYEHLDMCSFGRACVFDHPKKHSSTCGSTSASPSGVKTQESDPPQK